MSARGLAPAHDRSRRFRRRPRSCELPVVLVVPLTGDQDVATAPALHERLVHVTGRYPTQQVAVDLAAVTSMDRAGLAPLVAARARLGDRLLLRNVPARVELLLRAAGLVAPSGPFVLQAAGVRAAT